MSQDKEPEVPSEHEKLDPPGKVKTVFVNVSFLEFGKIKPLTGEYHADVLLTNSWKLEDEQLLQKLNSLGPSILDASTFKNKQYLNNIDWQEVWNPKLTINNYLNEGSQITGSHEVIMDETKAFWCIERKRFKGQFKEKLDVRQYPFDVQDLSVTVVSEYSKDQVVLVQDPTKIHTLKRNDVTDSQEWYIYNLLESQNMELCTDPLYPESQMEAIVVTAKVARRSIYYLLNHFLIFFLIASLVFTMKSAGDDEIWVRLQPTFTLLLTIVAYKFVVNQNLPKVSHFIYLDQYVMACIILLVVLSIWNASFPRYDHDTLEIIFYVVVAVCFLIFNIIFWIRIIKGPFKTRRQLSIQEHGGMVSYFTIFCPSLDRMVEKFLNSTEIQQHNELRA